MGEGSAISMSAPVYDDDDNNNNNNNNNKYTKFCATGGFEHATHTWYRKTTNIDISLACSKNHSFLYY